MTRREIRAKKYPRSGCAKRYALPKSEINKYADFRTSLFKTHRSKMSESFDTTRANMSRFAGALRRSTGAHSGENHAMNTNMPCVLAALSGAYRGVQAMLAASMVYPQIRKK